MHLPSQPLEVWLNWELPTQRNYERRGTFKESWTWWYMEVMLELGRQEAEGPRPAQLHSKFKAGLHYMKQCL